MQDTSGAPSLRLVAASQVPDEIRARLINEAYAGYYVPLQVTEDQVSRMDVAYDADLSRSVVAFAGAQPVGLTLLGKRGSRGWIHSVGTLPAWRRCGIARAMVAHVIASACEGGVERLSLEVLTQNTPAIRLYESLGFRPSRELLTWRRSADEAPLPIPSQQLVPADPAKLYGYVTSWQAKSRAVGGAKSRAVGGAKSRAVGGAKSRAVLEDELPCWQREVESLKKFDGNLKGYWLPDEAAGSFRRDWEPLRQEGDPRVVGCCLVGRSDHGVSIMAACIRPGTDALSYGRVLLQAISAIYPRQALSMSNIPADAALSRVLAALRFSVTMRQFEMILQLR
jgi:ribosomal protein S18 acetylase RimI-like enzyme